MPLLWRMQQEYPVIGVFCGGDTGEHIISLRSAAMVMKALEGQPVRAFQVVVQGKRWDVHTEAGVVSLDKNDFSFRNPSTGEKVILQAVYNIIHGSPGEDGRLQAWLDMAGIPYTGCGYRTSLITMNKYLCKQMLQDLPVALADGVLVRRGMPYDEGQILARCGLPLMVKPCNGGSSLGTHKVKTAEALRPALEDAFRHDDEVLCEAFVPGRELTCGVMRLRGELVALPVTEIIPHREFFDYAAKYEGASSEVTPARLSAAEAALIQNSARLVYDALQCRGIVRVDFILTAEGKACFLEVNTVPGFSEQSIIPQQLRAAGYREGEVLYEMIREALEER